MLKLNPNPTFKATIDITVPGHEKPEKMTFTFRYRNIKSLAALYEGSKDKGNVDAVMDMVEGWEGIDAEFTRENVETFVTNYPASPMEIGRAYSRLLVESRVKN